MLVLSALSIKTNRVILVLHITLAYVDRFSQFFFTVGLGNKFAARLLLHFPPRLKCVATLTCET